MILNCVYLSGNQLANELNKDTTVFVELLYNRIWIFDEDCIIDSVIFMFITLKMLWNNLYCTKSYTNKGE